MKYITYIMMMILFSVEAITENNNEIIEINNQKWSPSNLDTRTFRNGDSIFFVRSSEDWCYARQNELPACCFYNYDSSLSAKHGLLYNWYAVNDNRGLAPKGWKVPSVEDWHALMDYFGGEDSADTLAFANVGWDIYTYNYENLKAPVEYGTHFCDGSVYPYSWVFGTSSNVDSCETYFVDMLILKTRIRTSKKCNACYVRCIKDE